MFGIDDAALAILAAGALGTAGSIYANKKNTQMQNYWNSLSVDLANSAHQREVADLYLAGLNPILSSGGSGASTPQLTSPKVENALAELSAAGSNSAKYFSKEYANQIGLMESANQLQAIDAAIADSNKNYRATAEEFNLLAQTEQGKAQALQSQLVNDAYAEIFDDPKQTQELQDNIRDGVIAAAKDAANINWRHNIEAGTSLVNSAASAVNAGVNLYTGGKYGKALELMKGGRK